VPEATRENAVPLIFDPFAIKEKVPYVNAPVDCHPAAVYPNPPQDDGQLTLDNVNVRPLLMAVFG